MFAIGGSNFQGAASQCSGMKHSNIKNIVSCAILQISRAWITRQAMCSRLAFYPWSVHQRQLEEKVLSLVHNTMLALAS